MGRECELIDEETNDAEDGANIDEDTKKNMAGQTSNDLTSIYEELKHDAENLSKNKGNFTKRHYRLFAYVTAHKGGKSSTQTMDQRLFPSMNPNLSGNIPSVFSCKPRFRVDLQPGDVIFCYPKAKGLTFQQRRITLVLIVLKKVEILHALTMFPFKSVQYTQSFSFNQQNLFQFGDITASFSKKGWQYAGNPLGSTPHGDNPNYPTIMLTNPLCIHRSIVVNPGMYNPNKTLSCKGCPHNIKKYQTPTSATPCYMRAGTWQYDILFKWGLVGCCDASIPCEFRSFYLGSQGMPLQDFQNILGNPKNKKRFNERDYSEPYLDANGRKVLDEIRKYAKRMGLLK